MGDFDAAFGGWQIEGEPYTQKDGSDFQWFRSRMLGGRTNHWARISLRMGPKDFKCKTAYGVGDDWPVTYEEIAPYYDRVDKLIGVYGSIEKLENDPDGIFLPPPKPRLNELFVSKAATSLGITGQQSRHQPRYPRHSRPRLDPYRSPARQHRPPGLLLLRPMQPQLQDIRRLLLFLLSGHPRDKNR
jgi:choline dehydrogenase-like flavoprotein